MATRPSLKATQRLKGQRILLSPNVAMASFIEDMEDLLSEHKEADYNQFAETQGIAINDPRFAKYHQIFQSVKNHNVTSSCITIERVNSDSKREEMSNNAAPAIANPDWLYVQESDDEKDDLQPLTGKAASFRSHVQEKLGYELVNNDEIEPKSAKDLSDEAANEHCCESNIFDQIQENCPCFKRIHIMMEAYHQLVHDDELWNSVTISQVIDSNQYGHRQLMDDFMHIQLSHIDPDNKLNGTENGRLSMGQQMALYFMRKFPCDDMSKCKGNQRHFRVRQPKTDAARKREREQLRNLFRTNNDEDITFQEECDKIHSFFMQFGFHFA